MLCWLSPLMNPSPVHRYEQIKDGSQVGCLDVAPPQVMPE